MNSNISSNDTCKEIIAELSDRDYNYKEQTCENHDEILDDEKSIYGKKLDLYETLKIEIQFTINLINDKPNCPIIIKQFKIKFQSIDNETDKIKKSHKKNPHTPSSVQDIMNQFGDLTKLYNDMMTDIGVTPTSCDAE